MSTTDPTTATSDLPAAPAITALDYVGVPTRDVDRARRFYGETLGLRPDATSDTEFWIGSTCISIWDPRTFGVEFAPQKNAHLALQVDDVGAARAALEARGVDTFAGPAFDTGVNDGLHRPRRQRPDAPPAPRALTARGGRSRRRLSDPRCSGAGHPMRGTG